MSLEQKEQLIEPRPPPLKQLLPIKRDHWAHWLEGSSLEGLAACCSELCRGSLPEALWEQRLTPAHAGETHGQTCGWTRDRSLLVRRCFLPGLLLGVVPYPLSVFPTLTNLCCVLIGCNQLSDRSNSVL